MQKLSPTFELFRTNEMLLMLIILGRMMNFVCACFAVLGWKEGGNVALFVVVVVVTLIVDVAVILRFSFLNKVPNVDFAVALVVDVVLIFNLSYCCLCCCFLSC